MPDLLKKAGLPAPLGGLNLLSPAVNAPVSDAIYCYNMTAREMGLGPRLGSRQYATGLDGPVRTVLPFKGSQTGLDRLFVATFSGIWDVTGGGTSPTRVVTFPAQTEDSGYGVSQSFVDLNTGHNLLYTDEENGYYTYREATGVWTKVTRNDVNPGVGEIGGVNPGLLAFVMVWKNRVWLVEKNSARAWYLGFYSLYGAATAYNFGTKFSAGGSLAGLWNWTESDGSGADDFLVAISTGGDVGIYYGTDPAYAATFGMKGVWQIGGVPAGRRFASRFGGDLLVMSTFGAVPLSKLVRAQAADRSQYQTAKIPTLVNSLMARYKNFKGWSVQLHPEDGTMIVLVPDEALISRLQLVMSMATRGWSMYRGLNMTAAAEWNGLLYFGNANGEVWINTGSVDGVLLSDASSYTPIEFSLLTTYQALNTPNQKIVQFIRTTFLNPGGQLNFKTIAKYGYDMSEMAPIAALPIASAAGTWDAAIWDQSVWAGDSLPTKKVGGSFGMGPEIALAMRGQSISAVTLVGWHVFYLEAESVL